MSNNKGTTSRGARNPHPSGRVPKYQNKSAFTHNPKSLKSKMIMELPINGLCKRCTEQIEWKKQYRKYKPLKAPAQCRDCKERTVLSAYHNLCKGCAEKRNVCAKCANEEEIVNTEKPDLTLELEAKLKTFKERTRRTLVRKLEKGQIEAEEVLEMEGDKKKKDGDEDVDVDVDNDEDVNSDVDEPGNDNNKQ